MEISVVMEVDLLSPQKGIRDSGQIGTGGDMAMV